jgi:NTE family protein
MQSAGASGMLARSVTRRDWLGREPFTLVLSAGFFGFFAHTGLLAALERAGLVPRRIVGVSAGALAGGLWASGLSAAQLERELLALRRMDFWDPAVPLGGLLRGRKFADKLGELLSRTGVRTIEECRVPFVAIAHDVIARRTLPMGEGDLALAIRASCTVPFMFRPIWARGRLLVDGGVSDRAGTSVVGEDERVLLHYLPSRRRVRVARDVVPDAVPAAAASLVLVTPGLPKVGPFALEQGPHALARASDHAALWLDAPLTT